MRHANKLKHGPIFEPQETLVLIDAQERALIALGLRVTVTKQLRTKIAKIVLRIAHAKRKFGASLLATDLAREAVIVLGRVKSEADQEGVD